jgi:alginate O-acetyltransferase complex protein AlgI
MSFNSILFILAFLPAAVLGYYLLALTPLHRLRLPFLILMSLFFYGRAQVSYIPLVLGSIVVNYGFAVMIARNKDRERAKSAWLIIGVVINTGVLLSLKYLSPVVGTIAAAFGHASPVGNIVAPLAISFYTFQQISFLVDIARGKVVLEGLVRYTSFVAFFPTLLAGPITLYSELGPQLGIRPQRKGVAQNILIGLIIFSLGLFKKTVLADTAGLWVDPIFSAVHKGSVPGFFLGWGAAFTYTLQIYFDFSGYCDMAIGAARMFGLVLPLNFYSPLRSTSISDLWRRLGVSCAPTSTSLYPSRWCATPRKRIMASGWESRSPPSSLHSYPCSSSVPGMGLAGRTLSSAQCTGPSCASTNSIAFSPARSGARSRIAALPSSVTAC